MSDKAVICNPKDCFPIVDVVQIKTLRDEFAMAALVGLISEGMNLGSSNGSWTYPSIRSKLAYEYADEMMIERSKQGDK